MIKKTMPSVLNRYRRRKYQFRVILYREISQIINVTDSSTGSERSKQRHLPVVHNFMNLQGFGRCSVEESVTTLIYNRMFFLNPYWGLKIPSHQFVIPRRQMLCERSFCDIWMFIYHRDYFSYQLVNIK